MATYEELIETAVNGYFEILNLSDEQRNKWARSFKFFPPMVPMGDGSAALSTEGYKALNEFCTLWYTNDPNHKNVLNESAAYDTCRSAFGRLLLSISRFSSSTDRVKELLKIVAEMIAKRTTREHFYFPVRFFEATTVQQVIVGPVRFIRLAAWLEEVETVSGSESSYKKQALELIGKRREFPLPESISLGILLQPPSSQRDAENIAGFVGHANWIASVPVAGRDRSRSLKCAESAVRIAVDSLSLTLRNREWARGIRGPGDALHFRQHRSMTQFDGQQLLSGWRYDDPRVSVPPAEQDGFLDQTRDVREAVGAALRAYVDIQSAVAHRELKRRWVEAMYWFGQSRREADDFIALVKIGIAFDILAAGKKENGIKDLCCAVAGLPESTVISPYGHTISDLVKVIYKEGRSQIAHGGNRFGLLNDLPVHIDLANSFCETVLVMYIMRLSIYTGRDDCSDFLAALPSLTQAQVEKSP
jgi:hypothetical protein